MINDITAATGVIFLCIGVAARFGWEFSTMIVGLILIYIGYLGAVNDTETTTEQGKDNAT